jgi:hypothetical protein
VPSLQTTGALDALCAEETAGVARSATASAALKARLVSVLFVRFIRVLSCEPPLMFPARRIPQSFLPRYVGPDVVRLPSKLKLKLNEDPTR